jgi:hypothetical protein
LVVGLGEHGAVLGSENGPYRHLVFSGGLLGFNDCLPHELVMGHRKTPRCNHLDSMLSKHYNLNTLDALYLGHPGLSLN